MFRSGQVLAGSILTLCTLAAGAQAPPSLAAAPGAVAQADGLAPAVDPQVWTGFTFDKTPLFVFDAGAKQGLLFHVSPLPPEFPPLDAARGNIGLGPVPAGEEAKPGAAPLAGRLCAWIAADQVTADASGVQALYEQAFRVFEAYRGLNEPALPAGVDYPQYDAEGTALARAEGRVLARAVTASQADTPGLLGAFLSLRTQRMARLPQAIQAYEWGHEVTSGTAEYAGYVARAKVDPQGAQAGLAAELDRSAGDGVGPDGSRLGATGCALAIALDRCYPAWKEAFEKTARDSFQPLVALVASKAAPADTAFVGLDQLRQEELAAVAKVKAEQQRQLDGITKASGLVVALDLQDALAHPEIKWSNRYQPTGIMKLDDNREIRTRYYSLVGPGVLDFASSRPILIETRKSITAGFETGEIPYIAVDGKPVTLSPGETLTGSLELRGNHLTIKAAEARLSYTPKTLTIVPVVAAQTAGAPAGSPAPAPAG